MIGAEAYPESDFPYTFYLNGEEMPRWSNHFGYFNVLHRRVNELLRDWGTDYDDGFRGLDNRLDHVGVVESEDPGLFRVFCLAALLVLLRDREEVLAGNLRGVIPPGETVEDIYLGTRDGLFLLYQRCLADDLAFWTNGYEADREYLREYIRRHGLQTRDPEWREAPHLIWQQVDYRGHASALRGKLIKLAQSRSLPKEVCRQINALPRIS